MKQPHNARAATKTMLQSSPPPLPDRTEPIRRAREQVLGERVPALQGLVAPWIERSWQRCLAAGHRPEQALDFDAVSPVQARAAAEHNRRLVAAARPVLERVAQALAHTRYFALLTNAQGVVVDAHGAIDRSDRRAVLITRIGTDLSEQRVGTTAIGAALFEQQPVWLHRAEHFFADTGAYSCAGAPVRGADGQLAGMLDLTGIDVAERPELQHLAAQAACSIDNALALAVPHALALRLSWPGALPGGDSDGLLGLDGDGLVVAANPAARAMLALAPHNAAVHADALFAMPHASLFDAALHGGPFDVPLWSGLRLWAQAHAADRRDAGEAPLPLKTVEDALIRQAVDAARGNVALAARRLGISRATVYRKLGRR
ncbi:helix-turn-helix domain-containing protein [Pseudorhodoferax sp. Leaf274]|uniref:helix-turn-helix domain-containing protein n=1 Tax=Pseudorhodoferax sp. Leaf274 TaxID=1736318 RepID=UPI000ACFDC20|nr:helix-turn-helix domain-containing protein [Pseudorhodoferax sp. Leaf274]